MKPIQVGLLGIGTVGSGTFEVLKRNQEEIRRRAGRGIEITMVVMPKKALTLAPEPMVKKWCSHTMNARMVMTTVAYTMDE